MSAPHHFTFNDLVRRLESCRNKLFRDVDSSNVFGRINISGKNKGVLGAVIEQSVLGFPADSEQRPDLEVDGTDVELKVTGLVIDGGYYKAKEPMSICAVSPDSIVHETFSDSTFWHKAEHLLIVWYLYDFDNEYDCFEIKGFEFHEWSDFDRMVLGRDWQIVHDYIDRAQRDEDFPEDSYPAISTFLNPQLMYLDTAPKWPNPPRFRLKNKTVTTMARQHFGESLEQLPNMYGSFNEIDAELQRLKALYAGKTVDQLCDELLIGGNRNRKGIGEAIVVRMFGGTSSRMCDVEQFDKTNIVGKTVVLNQNRYPTEQTKLFKVDLDELWDEDIDFDESAFATNFRETHLLFIVFSEPYRNAPLSKAMFNGFCETAFSYEFIDQEVRSLWSRTREMIRRGTLVDTPTIKNDGSVRISPQTGLPVSAPNFPRSMREALLIKGTGSDARSKRVIHGISMYPQQNIWADKWWVQKQLGIES